LKFLINNSLKIPEANGAMKQTTAFWRQFLFLFLDITTNQKKKQKKQK
jgi:hypothetical protein